MPIPLLTPSVAYKPHKYPWCFDYWKLQQQIHWLPEEAIMGDDCTDWAVKLSDAERNLITQIFRFFVTSDMEVQDNYMERYSRVFKPVEVKMMLNAFANIESIHIVAYAYLIETLGLPEEEFAAFKEYQVMRDKQTFMNSFYVGDENFSGEWEVHPYATARTLAAFGGFVEGLQLFASFAMLFNFPRHNKLRGMGQILSWSIRDESLHCEATIKLFHQFCLETGLTHDPKLERGILDDCLKAVSLEDKFIDLAFELGPVEGMTPEDIKLYIRYIADWRLRQLEIGPVYNISEHPIPWMLEMTNGLELGNFFETKVTEYTKAATKGTWHDSPEMPGVWSQFDKRNRNKL